MKKLFILLTLFLFIACQQEKDYRKLNFSSLDGLPMTADLYQTGDKTQAWIILCHQAGYSRGEYREIAKKLSSMGYNCLAIDQRSGRQVNGVKNLTAKEARERKLPTEFTDALVDIEAAISLAKKELNAKEIILWGSSYSAALSLYLASQDPAIKALIAFSPGEYFTIDDKKIMAYSSEVNCPAFICATADEAEQAEAFTSQMQGATEFVVTPLHGSKTLWSENEGSQEVWDQLKRFLASI